jgi:signal transduction histidine kinase
MEPIRLSQPKSDNWFAKSNKRLYSYRPRFRDWHFWIVQGLVISIAAIHDTIEIREYLPQLGMLYFLPISLFFVPVAYAALNFGFVGSIATAIWVLIITIPNWVFWHQGLERIGVMLQMAVLIAIAVFIGQRIDRERTARQRAKAYAAHVIETQELERQRIARDLHDESIQTLVLLCQKLDGVKAGPSLPPMSMEKLQEARRIAEQAATGLRDFTRELRPPILDDLGMVAAIRKLMTDLMDRAGIDGQLKIDGEERRLPPDFEVGLFRIAQEALSNIAHHARATSVAVMITFAAKEVSLDIRDNGKGFAIPTSPNDAGASDKLGLTGMMERAEILGGSLEIESSPGKGTRIKVVVPLENNSKAARVR